MHPIYDALAEATEGMIYISESDYPIEPFLVPKESELGIDPASSPSLTFEAFFAPLIEEEDWFGDEEREDMERYRHLKAMLESHLSDLRVYKSGDVEKTITIAGRTLDGQIAGIRTTAIET
jgi:hypothetical protein